MNLLTFLQPAPAPAVRPPARPGARAHGGADRRGSSRIAERAASEAEDFLQTLMSARYADGRALDDEEITGLLLATVFAGQHTSAVLATWTGRAPARARDVPGRRPRRAARRRSTPRRRDDRRGAPAARRARAVHQGGRADAPAADPPHAAGAPGPRGRRLTSSRPAAWPWSRRPPPTGSPRCSRDPDRYDPDRFGPGRQEDRKHRHALIGFGGGHHRCIGSTFAYQQVKVDLVGALAALRADARAPRPRARLLDVRAWDRARRAWCATPAAARRA